MNSAAYCPRSSSPNHSEIDVVMPRPRLARLARPGSLFSIQPAIAGRTRADPIRPRSRDLQRSPADRQPAKQRRNFLAANVGNGTFESGVAYSGLHRDEFAVDARQVHEFEVARKADAGRRQGACIKGLARQRQRSRLWAGGTVPPERTAALLDDLFIVTSCPATMRDRLLR